MIDLTKPIELMDGAPAINPQRGDHGMYIIGVVVNGDSIFTDADGQIGGVQVIRNRPEPKKVTIKYWLNVYSDGIVRSHRTKGLADFYSGNDRIACVRRYIIVEEGEGL